MNKENSVTFTFKGIQMEAFYKPNEYSKGEFDPELTALFTATDSNTDILPLVMEPVEVAAYEAAIANERK